MPFLSITPTKLLSFSLFTHRKRVYHEVDLVPQVEEVPWHRRVLLSDEGAWSYGQRCKAPSLTYSNASNSFLISWHLCLLVIVGVGNRYGCAGNYGCKF